MVGKDKKTEEKIKDAAKLIFVKYGYDGARMQKIADEAGINKALVHYYFRSKEKLFERIFHDAFLQIVPRIGEIVSSVLPLKQKIEYFVESYLDFVAKNPFLPQFVVNELNRKPERIYESLHNLGINPGLMVETFDQQIKDEGIKGVKAQHLLANIISMCLFPFIGKPVLLQLLFEGDENQFDKFIEERKKEVASFILNALRNEQDENGI